MAKPVQNPTFSFEQALWAQGFERIAGIDEAGRGALAGPVIAAAVIVPAKAEYAGIWTQVRDSKCLSPTQRTAFVTAIKEEALAWGVGRASPKTIDSVNIAVATRMAMQEAVAQLVPNPDYLLIDWVKLPMINLPQQSLTKADQRIISVAAASILAKTYRDELLVSLAQKHPMYGFDRHKGYGTAAHRKAIEEHGPCPEHRHSFAPIAKKVTLFD